MSTNMSKVICMHDCVWECTFLLVTMQMYLKICKYFGIDIRKRNLFQWHFAVAYYKTQAANS